MADTDVAANAGTASDAPPPITSAARAATSDFNPEKAKAGLAKAAHDEQRELAGAVGQQGRLSKGYLDWMQNRIQAEGATIEEAKHGWNTQQELQKRETSLWEDFGSPAFIAAMIGSAFSARPMNSALMAGGAALNAIKQNKTEDYERAFEAWKANSDLAIKRMNMEHQQIQDIAHLANTSIANYHAQLRGIAAKYDNAGMIALMDAGHFDKVEEIIAKTPILAQKMLEATDALNTRKAAMDAVKDSKEYKSGDLQKKADMLLDAERKIRDAERSGKGSPAAAYTIQEKEAIRARLHKLHPDWDEGQLAEGTERELAQAKASPRSARQVFLQKLTTEDPNLTSKQMQAASAAYEESMTHARRVGTIAANIDPLVRESPLIAKQALDASKKLPRGDFVPWNEIKQKVLKQTSSPEMRVFHNFNQGLINIYSQAMNRGRGTATVHANQRAEELLTTTEGQAAYEAGVKTLLKEIEIVNQAVHDSEADIGGGGEDKSSSTSDPLGLR